MHPFTYERAASVQGAAQTVSNARLVHFIAGGTSQIDLMKENVHRPTHLVDLTGLPLNAITELPGGGLRLGANLKNSDTAYHPLIQERYPGLSEAILAGASAQIRNMASLGGNLLQRTRCPYFRDTAQACNKREPGTGCSALHGFNRIHAILGASEACIATHPSDMCVALAAHEAVVVVQGPSGERSIPFIEFHTLPGEHPEQDTTLAPNEIITAIDLPVFRGTSHYLKVRDRASYAFALVSAAVVLRMEGGTMRGVRIALGGVAHKPWRASEAEAMLEGKKPDEALFRAAATAAFTGARTLPQNSFKVPLGRNTLTRCLLETSGLRPLQGPKGTALASSAGGIAGEMPLA